MTRGDSKLHDYTPQVVEGGDSQTGSSDIAAASRFENLRLSYEERSHRDRRAWLRLSMTDSSLIKEKKEGEGWRRLENSSWTGKKKPKSAFWRWH